MDIRTDWSEVRGGTEQALAARLMKERKTPPPREREISSMTRRWRGYAVAVVGTGIAVLIRWALLRFVGDVSLFLTFYPAVFAAALIGGTGPGVLATLLSVLSAALFFIEPVGKLEPGTTADAVGLGLFLAINFTVSILGGRLRIQSQALKESESRLLLAHQAAHIGAFEWSLQTGVNIWTPALESMYGLKPGEFGGTEKAWERLVHPEDRSRAVATVERAVNTFQPQEGEWRVVWPDGSVHWLIGRFQAFKDHAGKPSRLVGANVDITGRKKAEEALRQSEERFRALVTAGSDVVYRMSPDWSEMRELHGQQFVADTEAPSRTWLQKYIYPEDQPQVIAAINEAIRTKTMFQLEHRVRRVDGTEGWTLSRAIPLLDANGEIFEWFGAASDVSRRKEAEQAVRESEERLRQFIDEAPVAIAMLDTEMRYLAASRRWLAAFGVSNQSLAGRSHYEVFPEIPERWKQVHRRCLAGAVERADEDVFQRADGTRHWVRWEVRPWYATPGKIGGLVIFSEEITARQEALEALRQSEERFRTMANAIPQLAWIARADGHIFWYNRRWYEYTGTTPEQMTGGGWQGVHDPQVLPKVLEQWRRSIATGEPFDMEIPLRGADGRFCPFLTRVMPLKDEEGRVTLWFGTNTDITELRERERALARQARLIDLAPAATLVRRPDGTITFWSQGAERLYGLPREEALGRRTNDLLRTEFPEPLESIVARLQGGGTWSGELRHYTRDGRQLVVESYWLAELNANGKVEELLESNTDITERKRLQAHLEEVVEERTAKLHEALADLEHMSYSMVHDMRAPLRAMQGFAEMIKEEFADCRRPPALDYVHRIRESANRLDRLITDALNYNQVVRENLPTTPVEIGRLLRGMINTYPNLQPPVAEISLEIDELFVMGNESLLTQCFGNLLDNATKFVAPGIRPRIRVWAEPADVEHGSVTASECGASEHEHTPRSAPNATTVRIWIADNGIGIPENAQAKIYHMFQRMHRESEYPGTGIGLAIVKKAVQRMGGRVGLESEPGRGSKFWVELTSPTRAQSQEPLQRVA
jgi:PAS domain S-box-containing protein